MGRVTLPVCITELERQFIVEQVGQALAEMEESEEISQGAIDGLVEALHILGVKYELQKEAE